MTVMKAFLVLSSPRLACLLTSQTIFVLAIPALFTLCPIDLVSCVCPSNAVMENRRIQMCVLAPSSLEGKHRGNHFLLTS